jgi:ribosomal protein S14
MKEMHEFRIFKDYYHLLPANNAKFNGMVYVLKISKDDPFFREIGIMDQELRNRHGKALFGFWDVSRSYTKKELANARLFHFNIKIAFEPTGEECGTVYDETTACELCGANRSQVGPLKLKKGSIPKKDIARTIAGEVVVSEKFAVVCEQRKLKGIMLEPVLFEKGTSKYYQLFASSPKLELTEKTIAGQNPFDLSGEDSEATEFTVSGGYKVKFDRMILKCPRGHLIGSKLISEAYVLNNPSIGSYDFFESKQKFGVKHGLLRPEPLYLCSQSFRKMVEEERLSGFDFEIANIE